MPRIGIIACQVLEQELASLLNSRHDIQRIFMVRSPENISFSRLLDCDPHIVHDFFLLRRPLARNEALIHILPAGLHADIDLLEEECNNSINEIKDHVSSILMFYGLCGNALNCVFSRKDAIIVPIEDGGIVDDCIVASLGRDEYMDELRKKGSLFLTNGWIDHWDKIVASVDGKNMFNTMLEMDSYRRVRYIKQENIEDKEKEAKIIAESLGLEYSFCNGKMELMSRSIDMMFAGR